MGEERKAGIIETVIGGDVTPVARGSQAKRPGARRLLSRLTPGRMLRLARGDAHPAAELRRHELSVVACDLRGFTAFCEAAAPRDIIALLRDYYGAIAEAVATFGGLIKEHAGDGTLALVGAASPSADHAERALAIAFDITRRGERVLSRRHAVGVDLGLGVGVASGHVAFGTIEVAWRSEPVAVGAAVNLAARLCARAKGGQILIDERTRQLARDGGASRFEAVAVVRFKGFSRPVSVFRAERP